MDARSFEHLQRRIDLSQRPLSARVARAPWRMIYSATVNRVCESVGCVRRSSAPTFWGGQMQVVFPELVSTFIYRWGFFESDLSTLLSLYLHPGQTVFDIGAHFGYMTLLCAESVGPTGHVHSFEPTPSTFEILKLNAGSKKNVTLNNAAVSSEPGQLQFVDFGVRRSAWNSAAGSRLDAETVDRLKPKPFTAKAVSIDSYVDETGAKPDFVKIDAEKAERFILQGAERTLRRERPVISLEVGDEPGTPPGEMSVNNLRHLIERDYRLFTIRGRDLVPQDPKGQYDSGNVICMPAERKLTPRAL
jgi:FkbM family methyltransferase